MKANEVNKEDNNKSICTVKCEIVNSTQLENYILMLIIVYYIVFSRCGTS